MKRQAVLLLAALANSPLAATGASREKIRQIPIARLLDDSGHVIHGIKDDGMAIDS